MKLLTVAIPCYNSEEYMANAIESLLPGGEEIEIIVVNDGSADGTPELAKKYADHYPEIVRVINQENGGHGQAVNTGLMNATGLYFKVVDSDDWVNEEALKQILDLLHHMIADGKALDMLIANYVYEKPHIHKHKSISFRSALPQNRIFGWSDIGHFSVSQNILMHSVIYRTKLLRDCGLKLPKHTFYVDNIFVYQPLPSVKTMYYLDVDFYRYFIGREDQSVNEKVMTRRVDQQIRVTKLMIDCQDLTKVHNKKLRNYMVKYLTMMMTVSSVYLVKEGSKESLEKRVDLWNYLEESNRHMSRMVNHCALSKPMQMKSRVGRKLIKWGYDLSRRIYKFG